MKVPLSVVDFLRRAEQVYGDRVALVDEPDQPASPWPTRRTARSQNVPAHRPQVSMRSGFRKGRAWPWSVTTPLVSTRRSLA